MKAKKKQVRNSLVLKDPAGNLRIVLDSSRTNGPRLSIDGNHGSMLSLQMPDVIPRLHLGLRNGQNQLLIAASSQGSNIVHYDSNSNGLPAIKSSVDFETDAHLSIWSEGQIVLMVEAQKKQKRARKKSRKVAATASRKGKNAA